ncbi:MAG: hypothetical protein H7X84_13045 [Verrucomicrobia bacterium]|nr:hypothetical protein [Prolixibacteraceae bacterium]
MSKLFTLNYLINSYRSGQVEMKMLQYPVEDFEDSIPDINHIELEPKQSSIDAILRYASQYEVLESGDTGMIELNLN